MTKAKELGKLAYFMGKDNDPFKDEAFIKSYIKGKDINEEQLIAILDWKEGYKEEQLQMEDV